MVEARVMDYAAHCGLVTSEIRLVRMPGGVFMVTDGMNFSVMTSGGVVDAREIYSFHTGRVSKPTEKFFTTETLEHDTTARKIG